jgi:pyridoxine 5-phosphate synthase
MTELIARIDSVAAVRSSGAGGVPEPAVLAAMAELGGADAVSAHLREDRSQIRDRDLRLMREIVHIPVVLEMSATSEMIGAALDLKPDRVFLVSEDWEVRSPEGSLDLIVHREKAAEAIRILTDAGISVGVCIEADPEQIRIAHRIEAAAIQVETAFLEYSVNSLSRVLDAAKLARKLKLPFIAGTDVTPARMKTLSETEEVDGVVMGHSLVALALMKAMPEVVREMLAVLNGR